MSTKSKPLWKKMLERVPRNWSEKLDTTPVAVPAGFGRPPSLQEQMIALIRSEAFNQAVKAQGFGTLEEEEDFDVGDFDPTSPYELEFEPSLGKEVTKQERQELARDRRIFDDYVSKKKKEWRSKKKEEVKEKPSDDSKKGDKQ